MEFESSSHYEDFCVLIDIEMTKFCQMYCQWELVGLARHLTKLYQSFC